MSYELLEKQINLENYCTVYLEGGISLTDPILFLHGWTISVAPYRESLSLLCQTHRVIAPDLPGFGKTTKPTVVQDYDGYINCIVAFLQALDLQKVHVVGHSGGGAVAMALAALQPSFVSSLIVIDSTGIPLGSLPEVVLRRLIELPTEIFQITLVPTLQFCQALGHNCIFKPQNILQAVRLALENDDLRPLLPKIKCPTLVVWGENDLFIPLEMGQELAQRITNSRFVTLPGEYHEWVFFKSQKFVAIASNFINEIEQAKINC